jgi:hypothetical protein
MESTLAFSCACGDCEALGPIAENAEFFLQNHGWIMLDLAMITKNGMVQCTLPHVCGMYSSQHLAT